MINNHQNRVEEIFYKACNCLKVTGFTFKIMNRQAMNQKGSWRAPVNKVKKYLLGYTNLKTKVIAIDIFTPKKRLPKSINSILRIIAHEIAHHQKKPFKQLYRGHIITRSHYPGFYRQVNKNILKYKKDPELKLYFT